MHIDFANHLCLDLVVFLLVLLVVVQVVVLVTLPVVHVLLDIIIVHVVVQVVVLDVLTVVVRLVGVLLVLVDVVLLVLEVVFSCSSCTFCSSSSSFCSVGRFVVLLVIVLLVVVLFLLGVVLRDVVVVLLVAVVVLPLFVQLDFSLATTLTGMSYSLQNRLSLSKSFDVAVSCHYFIVTLFDSVHVGFKLIASILTSETMEALLFFLIIFETVRQYLKLYLISADNGRTKHDS